MPPGQLSTTFLAHPAWGRCLASRPFIPSSAGAAEPALELIESYIRGRDGDLKAAHCYFIIQPNKDMLA